MLNILLAETQSATGSNVNSIIIYIIIFGIIGLAVITGCIFFIYYLIKKLIDYYKQ